MSSQCIDVIDFVKIPGSSDINFGVIENYQHDNKNFSKLSARLRFSQRQGDETFFATYWKPGLGPDIAEASINALVFICHGYAEYIGEAYDQVVKV